MTPQERAARHRISALLDALDPGVDTIVTFKRGDALIPLEDSDLRVALAALDRYDGYEQAVQSDARQIATEAGFAPAPDRVEITYEQPCLCYRDGHYVGLTGPCTCALRGVQDCPCLTPGPRGQCEECSCCAASGCHPGPGSTCPTDRLGDSVCPCTGD